MTQIKTKIPAELEPAAVGGMVTDAKYIIDRVKNKNQTEVNAATDASINQLSNEIDAVNTQDIVPVDSLPAVGSADPRKIYRVVGETSYTDNMVNAAGDGWKELAVYTFPGIDNEPTPRSNNLVKSGGVAQSIKNLRGISNIILDNDAISLTGYYIYATDGPYKGQIIQGVEDSVVSKLIDVQGLDTLHVECGENLVDYYGYRFLEEDEKTIASSGKCEGTSMDLTVPNNACYFQISQPLLNFEKLIINAWFDGTLGNIYTELKTKLIQLINSGYVYSGLASPTGTPSLPEAEDIGVIFVAKTAGTYTNYGNITVPEGISILKYKGTWQLEVLENKGLEDIFSRTPYLVGYYIYSTNSPLKGTIQAGLPDSCVSDLMDVQGMTQLTVKSKTSLDVIHAFRFLNQNDAIVETIVPTAVTELSINIPSTAKYFQISQPLSVFKDINVIVPCKKTLGDVSNRITELCDKILGTCNIFASSLYEKLGYYIYTTEGALFGEVVTGTPDSMLSRAIEINSSAKILLRNIVEFNQIYGYRFLNSNGEKVSAGAFTNTKEMTIEVPSGAVYFQFSQPAEIYATTELFLDYDKYLLSKIIDRTNYLVNSEFIKNGGFSAENIAVGSNESQLIISNDIVNHEWDACVNIRLGGALTNIKIKRYKDIYIAPNGSYIEITPTSIIEHEKYDTETYNHGLTIEDAFTVLIKKDVKCSVMLIAKTGIYKTDLKYFNGTDTLSVENGNAESITVANASLDLSAGMNESILVFGDSYCDEKWGVEDDIHYGWTSILKNSGAKFSNLGYPGGTAQKQFLDYIGFGSRPKFIIWAVGMNNLGDTSHGTVPDGTWLANIQQAQAIADAIGAQLIPCTIPSVSRRKTGGKNNYIRTNYKRYIDFDNALTNKQGWQEDNSNWISGYLDSDGVHPTRLGFAAMVAQALVDFPEFLY